MTTIQAPSPRLSRLTFGGTLRSEWIKLRTLRSTMWCYIMVIVVTVGIGLLVSAVVSANISGTISAESQRSLAVSATTAGTVLSSLIVAVLGALVITGEYGTGMIRSTLTAVPKRTPALVAKALVFGATTFVVVAVSLVITSLIASSLLPGHVNLIDSRILLPLLGNAGYLALLGMFALFVGAIIRSSAGGIAVALGFVLVVPIILATVGGLTGATWPSNLNDVMPDATGGLGDKMAAYVTAHATPVASGAFSIDPGWATLIMVGWVVVFFALAAILLKKRDA